MGKISAVFGQHDEKTLTQLQDVASRAEMTALMADGHLGYIMPIGGVAAYRNKVSPVGVGFDIACGNAAIRTDLILNDITDLTLEEVRRNPHRLMADPTLNRLADDIFDGLSFGIGRKNESDDAPVDDPLFLDHAWYAIPNIGGYRDELQDKARRQLGTIGSGNHYVDVFVDEFETIWVGVHFGSRGFGHTIASNFLALSQGGAWGDRGREEEILLDLDDTLGHDYFALMNLAGRYAYAGREWVARKVVEWLGGNEVEMVHNHHNFAWKEEHFGEEYVVVRKGATPAFPGQKGFIGGSMGDNAVIVQGFTTEGYHPSDLDGRDGRPDILDIASQQEGALFSTVHGAGRVMSRTAAKGKWKKGRQVRRGAVTHQMQAEWLAREGVILRGGGLDEAPQAYRRLDEVLTAQGATVEVLHSLKPIIACMAPANERDPYKD